MEPASKRAIAISPDGRTVAAFQSLAGGRHYRLAHLATRKRAEEIRPDPFASKTVYNVPTLDFSPDGKHLLVMVNAGRRDEEMWLARLPPSRLGRSAANPLPELRTFGGTPEFAWMPDNRRVVLALQPAPDAALQLWMADTTSGERHAITSGTSSTGGSGGLPGRAAADPDRRRRTLRHCLGGSRDRRSPGS